MNEEHDFALVPRPPSAVEKAKPGAKRILSSMVMETLTLAKHTQAEPGELAQEAKSLDEQWNKAAEAGDSEAQFKLGEIHAARRSPLKDRSGKYVTARNLDEELCLAFHWFNRAADQGHAQAQHRVAFCYFIGSGVDQDDGKAFDYLRLAGSNGCSEAWRILANRLIFGTLSTKPAAQEGFEYMRKAAEAGNGIAGVWLSRLYRSGRVRQHPQKGDGYVEGIEVAPDVVESTRWLRVAADKGFAEAQVLLAECYLDGDGVVQDITKAAMWYRKAAEALSREEFPYDEYGATISLARCYTHGRGVSKDLAEAFVWLKFGAEATDDEDTNVELASLCSQMSQSELTEGQNRYQQLQQARKKRFDES